MEDSNSRLEQAEKRLLQVTAESLRADRTTSHGVPSLRVMLLIVLVVVSAVVGGLYYKGIIFQPLVGPQGLSRVAPSDTVAGPSVSLPSPFSLANGLDIINGMTPDDKRAMANVDPPTTFRTSPERDSDLIQIGSCSVSGYKESNGWFALCRFDCNSDFGYRHIYIKRRHTWQHALDRGLGSTLTLGATPSASTSLLPPPLASLPLGIKSLSELAATYPASFPWLTPMSTRSAAFPDNGQPAIVRACMMQTPPVAGQRNPVATSVPKDKWWVSLGDYVVGSAAKFPKSVAFVPRFWTAQGKLGAGRKFMYDMNTTRCGDFDMNNGTDSAPRTNSNTLGEIVAADGKPTGFWRLLPLDSMGIPTGGNALRVPRPETAREISTSIHTLLADELTLPIEQLCLRYANIDPYLVLAINAAQPNAPALASSWRARTISEAVPSGVTTILLPLDVDT